MNSSFHRRRRRSAHAAIELLMSLPVIILLFLMVFTVGVVGQAVLGAVFRAREAVWTKRNEAAASALAMPGRIKDWKELGKILNPATAPPVEAGLVTETVTGEVEVDFKPVGDLLDPFKRRHALFVGVWDGDALKFDRRAEHRRLTLDSRFENFGLSRDVRSAFRELVP